MMLRKLSIKSLYALALAEGEGVGTAYEYFAKRLTLGRWLNQMERPSHILIAGLPQKYGASLDFLQLADELGAGVTVVDERPAALDKLRHSLAAAQEQGWLTAVTPAIILVDDLVELGAGDGRFDLSISCEVLQRLAEDERAAYIRQISRRASANALFAPNGDNPAHTHISGLSGVTLAELSALLHTRPRAHAPTRSGYIDMPPFPPGITRDEAQREQAASGKIEALAMRGLEGYARLERFLPQAVRRRHAHIVFALSS